MSRNRRLMGESTEAHCSLPIRSIPSQMQRARGGHKTCYSKGKLTGLQIARPNIYAEPRTPKFTKKFPLRWMMCHFRGRIVKYAIPHKIFIRYWSDSSHDSGSFKVSTKEWHIYKKFIRNISKKIAAKGIFCNCVSLTRVKVSVPFIRAAANMFNVCGRYALFIAYSAS